MKLFKITQKRTEGQCDAMRCRETDVKPGWRHPYEDDSVSLCSRHAQELTAYINMTSGQSTEQPSAEQPSAEQPQRISPVTDRTMALGLIPPRSLESILTENLAVKNGVIESRQATAEKINSIALAFEINDRDTRDKADQLVALVHEEEKAIKAEIDAMYRPVKNAAKATKERLDSWFGPTLEFYQEAKAILKEKLASFRNSEKERETKALESGNHEIAAECVTDNSENVTYRKEYQYAIENGGINLPPQLLVPDETKNDDIVKLLPRELLRPNYDLIDAIVKEHGKRVEIPDVTVIEVEKSQMKPGRR